MDLTQHKATGIEITKSRNLAPHGYVTKIIIRSLNDKGEPVADNLNLYHDHAVLNIKQLEEEFAY